MADPDDDIDEDDIDEDEPPCATCDNEGLVERDACGTSHCTCDGFSGGCTFTEKCSDCGRGDDIEAANEPDWDSMREAREENRMLAEMDYED